MRNRTLFKILLFSVSFCLLFGLIKINASINVRINEVSVKTEWTTEIQDDPCFEVDEMIRTHKGDIILFCNAWGRSETGEEIEYTYGTIYSINSDNGAINWKTKVNPYLLIELKKVIDTGAGLLFESDITYECVWQPGGEGYDCMVPSYVFLDYNGNVKWVSKEESLTLQQKSIVDDTLFNDKYGKSLKDKLEEMYYFYKKTDTISIVKQINAEDERVYTLVNITLDSKPFPVFIIQNKEDDQIIIKQIDSSKITYATDFELFEDTICIVGKQYKAISNASKTNYHFSTMILNRSNGEELHTYTEKEEIDDFHAWIKNVNNA
ncbi:MAG: hypothetical protein LBR25_02640, partial [Erysipelotrichaceae bacterium]|nr:hypothetical protein [Erysipelotrichaceae bacterium]